MANKTQARLAFIKGRYGENWRSLRESTGMTVRDFANEMHYSYSKISKIENESEYPTIEQINEYQAKFNVSLDYLIGLTTTKDIEKNKITRYTGLSEEAIDKLHNIIEKANTTIPDDEALIFDNSTKPSLKTVYYNMLICNDSFDNFLNELKKLKTVTSLLSDRICEINSFDDIIDGNLRGLIMKASLSQMSLRNSMNQIIAEFDETNSSVFEKAWEKLQSDLENKCGMAEGADEEDIEIAKKHLKGKLTEHEYSSQTAANTIGILMLADVDD